MDVTGLDIHTCRIEKVWGTDLRLHSLIGPFVMNPDVIRLNGGYPFKNTEDHLWYISVKGKNMVTGFLSIRDGHICNDFTWRDNDVLEALLDRALSEMEAGTPVCFTAEEYELPVLEKLGFTVARKSVRYFKMAKTV
ncbi:hypothetical protein IR083_00050 [Dysgonomonas sp. GY75]|uniref:hypothetical protein n=1 Tax=Dysgonomonas sp. GY75 TaxID=2780419 RepID=UPI00188330C9|nr:hypothetical protein [Dysgonomonas sp. GY75]MBF0647213.1 hypothetical protein [Dysgonomonas sp. GY75]